ncbi:MAG: T9SS type A sorting domain-containing protein [Bacteroidota bacterium]
MPRQLVALVCFFAASVAAQPSGVLVHDSGGNAFRGGVAVSNPTSTAPNTVAITPTLNGDTGVFTDSLEGRPVRGAKADFATLSPTGRVAFHANWLDWGDGVNRTLIYAQNRDGTNRTRLTDTTAASRGQTPRDDVQDRQPAISPDGQIVAFLSTRFRDTDANGTPLRGKQNVFLVPSTGGTMQQITQAETDTLTSNGSVATCSGIDQVAWSPDGTRLAYIGTRAARDASGNPYGAGCESQIGTMKPDGTDIQVLRGSRTGTTYSPGPLVLRWTAGGILYHDGRTNALEIMDSNGGEIRRVPFQSTIDDVTVRLDHGWALSPDGQFIATTALTTSGAYPVIFDLNLEIVDRLTGVPSSGTRPMDWVDAPPVPAADRIELASPPSLLWDGIQASLVPTIYDASGNVIVVGAWHWSHSLTNGFSNRIDRMAGVIHGTVFNQLDVEVCASNGGLEACTGLSNVHTPIVTAETIEATAEEDGRKPGRIRLQRFGNPVPDVNAQISFSGTAARFRDYTASDPGPLLRLASGDTLTTVDLDIIPVDDGVDEGDERVRVRVECPQGSNCVLGSNSIFRDVTIVSNGAGAGLGIASARPRTAQAGGLVTLTLAGQGFGPDATVSLSGPAAIEASAVFVRSEGTVLAAQFNLREAPTGTYGLAVSSGGDEAMLASALRVIDDGEAETWATMIPNFHVGGFPSRQRVVYGNRGEADAYMVPLFVAVGTDASIEMRTDVVLPPGLSPEMQAAFEPYLHPDSLFTLVEQCVPEPGPIGGAVARRTAGTDGCFDSFEMRVAMFVIPVIPAGSSGSLEFSITVGGPPGPLPMAVSIGSIGLPDVLAAVTGHAAPECATSGATSSAMRRDTGENPTAAQIGSACLACILAIGGVALEFVPGAGCIEAGLLAVAGITNNLLGAGLSGFDDMSVAMGGAGSIAGGLGAMAECAGSFFPPAKLAATAAEAISLVAKVASTGIGSAGAIGSCVDCGKKLFWEYYYSFWARSFDPNIKVGPPGVGENAYVRSLASASYVIQFENLEDATASAREVTIVDTLDTSRYDLSTFQLGPISIPDTTVTPPPGLQSWTTYVDRRPAQPSMLRFDAHLDVETGIARWVISDLDPVTFGYRDDAGAGFLPPNVNAPEGEGAVSFLIEPLEGLGNGTVIANRASIRFDREEWILTPTWANTLDFMAPTSSVTTVSANTAASDTSYTVTVSASDGGSGIQRTALYASVDDGPFELVTISDLGSDGDVPFEAERGRSYGFFALAVDWTGNEEALKTEAEATLSGPVANEGDMSLPKVVEQASPYPNPTNSGAVVQFGLPSATRAEVRVFDMRGREVAQLVDERREAGWHRERFDASALAPGVYVVRLMADGTVDTQTLTIVR